MTIQESSSSCYDATSGQITITIWDVTDNETNDQRRSIFKEFILHEIIAVFGIDAEWIINGRKQDRETLRD